MGTPSAIGSLLPVPASVFAHRITWGLTSRREHPFAPWSCPRRPYRNRRDLAPLRLEAAFRAPALRLLLPSGCLFPCVRRQHLAARGGRPDWPPEWPA